MSRLWSERRVSAVPLACFALLIPTPSAGQLEGRFSRDSVRLGAQTRTYVTYVPRHVEERPGLVLVLHGGGGSGEGIRTILGGALDSLADEHGFVVAYPDGYEGHWNDCRARATFAAKRLDVDDVAFIRELVQRVIEQDKVDVSRIFVFGFSNGGHLGLRLALEAPDVVRAVAVFSANLPVQGELDCEDRGGRVPVIVVNGTADPISPYDGGEGRTFEGTSRGGLRSAMETARYFARVAPGSGSTSREIIWAAGPDGLSVERTTFEGDTRGVLVTVHGGGHTIPGPSTHLPAEAGPVERRYDAPREALAFFLQSADTGGSGP